MADFIRPAAKDKPDMTVEIYYDGKMQKDVEITANNLFSFDNKFVLEGEEVDSRQARRSSCARRAPGRCTSTPT